MRAVLFILIIALVAVIAAVATGLVNIQGRGSMPQVSSTQNGVVAKGGQPPAFDVETGTVKIGSKQTNVTVPTVSVVPPPKPAAASNQAK